MKSTGFLAAAIVAALAAADSGAALAQAPRADARPPSPSAAAPPNYAGSAGEADEAEGAWAPVLKVTGVEVMRSQRPPELDVIRVQGVTSTDAWATPELVPLTRKPASDGVLELLFVARAPTAAIHPTPFGKVEAIFVVEPGHPYKAIRVRGASNSVQLTRLPGWVEAAAPKVDCSECVGKVFVAKGSTPPAGVPAADLVREEDMPTNLRVLRPADGVAKLDTDPNRLTLVVGDDGRISYAVWD